MKTSTRPLLAFLEDRAGHVAIHVNGGPWTAYFVLSVYLGKSNGKEVRQFMYLGSKPTVSERIIERLRRFTNRFASLSPDEWKGELEATLKRRKRYKTQEGKWNGYRRI